MQSVRSSAIGATLYVLLAGSWLLVIRPGFFEITQTAQFQSNKEYVLIILFGMILALVIVLNRRQRKDIQEKLNKLEQESLRRQSYLDALIQMAGRVKSETSLPAVLESICRDATSSLGIEAAALTLYHPQRAIVELAASHGLPDGLKQRFREIPFSASYLQKAFQDAPLILSAEDGDVSGLPHGHLYRESNFKTMLYIPLVYEQDFLGELTVLTRERRDQFAPDLLILLKAFAELAALAIRANRLSAEIRESDRKLEILRAGDLAILSSLDLSLTLKVFLQQVVEQLKVDAADVLLFNAGTQMLEYTAGIGFVAGKIKEARVPLGTGYAGKIALERRSMYLSDINATGPFYQREFLGGEGFVSYFGSPLIAKGQVKGVLEVFHRRSFYPMDNWLSFLETLGGQAAIAIDNASLFSRLQQMNVELSVAYDRTLEGWSHALDLRDRETEGHTERVTDLCMRLAREFNLREDDLIHVRRGALLHDIGKMGVPDYILHKPTQLNDEEQQVMKMHPTFAFEMLSPISYLQPALDIPYCHHERWDGEGYPRRLQGEVIPLPARIFAVVDVWDALTTDRPYRKALTHEDARQYLREQAGKQFDPHVVDVFLRLMD